MTDVCLRIESIVLFFSLIEDGGGLGQGMHGFATMCIPFKAPAVCWLPAVLVSPWTRKHTWEPRHLERRENRSPANLGGPYQSPDP